MNFKQKLMACTALLGAWLLVPAAAGAQSASEAAKIERLGCRARRRQSSSPRRARNRSRRHADVCARSHVASSFSLCRLRDGRCGKRRTSRFGVRQKRSVLEGSRNGAEREPFCSDRQDLGCNPGDHLRAHRVPVDGSNAICPILVIIFGETYADLGKIDDAWRCIGEATAAIEMTKQRWCEAE